MSEPVGGIQAAGAFAHELISLIGCFRSPAKLLASGDPGRRMLKEAGLKVLGHSKGLPSSWNSASRLALLYQVARGLELLRVDGEYLRVDGEEARSYFCADSATRAHRTLRAYRLLPNWSSLGTVRKISVDEGPRGRGMGVPDGAGLARARGVILDVLGAWQSMDWFSMKSLSESVKESHPSLLFAQETGAYYPGVTRVLGGGRVMREGGWETVEQGYIHRVIEQLSDLGVLELRPAPGADLELRVTPDGWYALGSGVKPTPAPSVEGALVVQPNFEVVILSGRQEISLTFVLERFAERVGPAPGTTYRLDEKSAYRAAREGMEVEEVLSFLEQHSSTPLPGGVVFALKDWGRRQHRIRVQRRVAILEATDGSSLDLLPGADAANAAEARRLGDRWMVVSGGDRRAIIRCLGHNHFVELDYLGDLPPCASVSKSLELSLLEDKVWLHAPRLLERLCEQGEDGVLRLSRASLLAALEAGMSAAEVTETLERLVVDGVPPEVRLLLDALSGNASRFHLTTSPILVASSARELDRLLALRAVAERLIRRLGPCVAMVEAGAEVELRQALLELGVVESTQPLEDSVEHVEPVAVPDQPMTTRDSLATLREAIRDDREVVIRYDPGARQPVQDLRVTPVELSQRNGVHYLRATQSGRREARSFSMNFVASVRPLGERPFG